MWNISVPGIGKHDARYGRQSASSEDIHALVLVDAQILSTTLLGGYACRTMRMTNNELVTMLSATGHSVPTRL